MRSVADIAPPTVAEDDIKRLATATARAALLGATLHVLRDDAGRPELIVTRWALTRSFATLTEVEKWLDRFEGATR